MQTRKLKHSRTHQLRSIQNNPADILLPKPNNPKRETNANRNNPTRPYTSKQPVSKNAPVPKPTCPCGLAQLLTQRARFSNTATRTGEALSLTSYSRVRGIVVGTQTSHKPIVLGIERTDTASASLLYGQKAFHVTGLHLVRAVDAGRGVWRRVLLVVSSLLYLKFQQSLR